MFLQNCVRSALTHHAAESEMAFGAFADLLEEQFKLLQLSRRETCGKARLISAGLRMPLARGVAIVVYCLEA